MSKYRIRVLGLVLSAAFLCVHAQTASETAGSISGIVTDESNGPVSRATIVYNNVRTIVRDGAGHLRPTAPIISASTQTDSGGSFVISNLPEGDYYLCAIGVPTTHLRSCEWDGDYSISRVAGGRTTTRNFRLRSAALINLSVSDSNGRIAAAGSRSFLPSVISQTGQAQPFTPVSATATTLSYRVAVPRGATVYLLIDTALTITDSNAQPVRRRVAGLRVSAESSETAVTVNVQ